MSFEINSFLKLKSYCEKEQYKGWDPYDGLNSKIFQATPFKYWGMARLAWIQAFKRSCEMCFISWLYGKLIIKYKQSD